MSTYPHGIEVGDEVRVYDVTSHFGIPAEGLPGVVWKSLPPAVYIAYDGIAESFWASDRVSNDMVNHRWFRTAAQGYAPEHVAAERERRTRTAVSPDLAYRKVFIPDSSEITGGTS